MTKEQLREYIQSNVCGLAAERYPTAPSVELHYAIGFLISQLAEAAYDDNRVLYRFRDAIERAR